MKKEALIPALDAIYQKDQAKFSELKRQRDDLQRKIVDLNTPAGLKQNYLGSIEHALIASKYQEWRKREVIKIARKDFDLQPELEKAKAKLKKSFGRLEALRAIIEDKSR